MSQHNIPLSMLRISPFHLVFRVSIGLAACGCGDRDGGLGPGVSVRDSAGVSIVRSNEPRWRSDSAWRIAAAPLLNIGGADGTWVGRVVGAVRTPSGAIAVADGDAQVIRVYDLNGRLLRSLGRRGSGAGEFQALQWIAPAGDSILAFDLVTRRLTMFGAGGRIRTASLDNSGAVVTAPLGRFADGSLLVASGGPTFPFAGLEGEVQRDSAQLLRYDADGDVSDTIASVRWTESFGVAIGEEGRRFLAPMPRPYGPRTSALVVAGNVVVGEADRHQLRVYGPDGVLRRIVRRERTPLPVTPEAIAAFKEAQRRGISSGGAQAEVDAALARALDSAPYPASLPAYDRVLGDGEANLWVLDFALRRDQPETWNVFDPDGRWLGTVVTPARFRVEQVGNNWILGVWRDAEDAEHVRMYSIVKP